LPHRSARPGDGAASLPDRATDTLGRVPYAPLLPDDEVDRALSELPGWERRDGRLIKTFRRRDFRDSLQLLLAVADAADEQDHHPDVRIRWDRIEFSLRTHVAGGITTRDLRLARTIDEIHSASEAA
jgi:4a-hydroxytetrahydrobiopterin dehydratase